MKTYRIAWTKDSLVAAVIEQDNDTEIYTLTFEDGSTIQVDHDDLLALVYTNQWWTEEANEQIAESYYTAWSRRRVDEKRKEEEAERLATLQLEVPQDGELFKSGTDQLVDLMKQGWLTLEPYPVKSDGLVRVGYQVLLQDPRELKRKTKRLKRKINGR